MLGGQEKFCEPYFLYGEHNFAQANNADGLILE
jgi:hypothetical protein